MSAPHMSAPHMSAPRILLGRCKCPRIQLGKLSGALNSGRDHRWLRMAMQTHHQSNTVANHLFCRRIISASQDFEIKASPGQ